MTGRLALTAIDWDAADLSQALTVMGWDLSAEAAPDVRLLAAADGRVLVALLADGDVPTLCLANVDAVDEGALLRAGAHLVLPLATAPEDLGTALATLLRLADPASRALRVGDLALHVDRRVALCRGRPLALPPLEFDLLLMLASRAGQVVPAAELRARLWPDAVDAADRLAAHIHRLRRALGAAVPLHTRGHRGYVLGGSR
ncbi:MAG: winged helix-turn-helix domain-containing protein [Azospirillaceae bacterium]|nr:winged helix-turn-helix domain-containing protein [Azospirillaceae bacterium]